jgi:hypothetical protein
MDKLRWMPPDTEEANSTIMASDDYQPQGIDSEGSSFNNNANMPGEMDDGVATIVDESMENDPEDQPPLGSNDEEQVN